MVVRIHKFLTEIDALIAIGIINTGEGIPKGGTSKTNNYTTPLQEETFWYIWTDDITKQYLGEGEDYDFPETPI